MDGDQQRSSDGNGRVTIALLQQGQTEILRRIDAVAAGVKENSDRIRGLELAHSGCQSGLLARVDDLEDQVERLEGRTYGLATGNAILSGVLSALAALFGK